jgi:hypothetical protein
MSLARNVSWLFLGGLLWGGLLAGLGCSGGSGLPQEQKVDAPPAMGRFSVAWTIADGARALTCDEVGALFVSVEVVATNSGGGYVEAFTCDGKMGTSKQLLTGDYDLAFEMRGRSGSLGVLASQRVKVTSDAVTAAAPLMFPVVASGLLDSKLLAGSTSNCGPGPTGSNIASMTLVMEKQGGPCVPTTFTIGAGATRPAATYVSTCATPTPAAPCIERDQAVTATIGSGPYVIRARGVVGAALCWTADQLLDVPPERRTAAVDVSLAYLKGTAGCP